WYKNKIGSSTALTINILPSKDKVLKDKNFFFLYFATRSLPYVSVKQGRTDHLETRALPEGPGCPWYLFHRLF
ncbi:unnamed protein product, partial [Staurois parvus]